MIYNVHVSVACGGFSNAVKEVLCATLSFFMSWFFFKGGMVHKDMPVRAMAHKSARRLLVPFLMSLLLGVLLDWWQASATSSWCGGAAFTKNEVATFLSLSVLWPTAASWFLLSLFVARVGFDILRRKVHPLAVTVVAAGIAYAIHVMNSQGVGLVVRVPWIGLELGLPTFYMGNMCHGLSLYSLGYYLKERQFDRAVFAIALALFALKFFIPSGMDFRANAPSGVHYLLSVLYGMAGCVVINNVFKKFCNKRIPLVTYMGRISMVYYLVHYPVMTVVTTHFWGAFAEAELWLRFLVLSLMVTLSLVVAEFLFRIKKLRFMIGG